MCQKASESFQTVSFGYHRASVRHLGCMNVLAYASVCSLVCMRYRSGEIIDLHGRPIDINVYVCFLTANKLYRFRFV